MILSKYGIGKCPNRLGDCYKYPQADIEVWCEDEQRLGLQPKARRVWTKLGQQPVADIKTQYQWLWLYGFLDPESGETYFWIRCSCQHRAI